MAILTAILAVFEQMGLWISETVQDFIPMFWTTGTGGAGELTFLGVLCVASLAMSVGFLLIGLIQRFMRFS